MKSIFYLATLVDRHIDDVHRLFSTFGMAQSWCVREMKAYGNRYVWQEPDWNYEPDWSWYRTTEIDDGPKVMVAAIRLDIEEE